MTSDDDYWAHYSTRGGLDSEEKAREAVERERGCSEEEWNEKIRLRDERADESRAQSKRDEDEHARKCREEGYLYRPTGYTPPNEEEY